MPEQEPPQDRSQCPLCRFGRAAGAARCPLVRTPKKAGTRIYRAGAPADGAFYVVEGEVLLVRDGGEGEKPRALRGRGSLVGLESVTGGRYEDDAVCTVQTQLCALPRSRLEAWIAQSPAAARAVAELAVEEAQRVAREIPDELPCLTRLARFVLGRHRRGARSSLPKQTVAALLHMRPETLSRCARRLGEAGAIDPRSFTVSDEQALEASATR